MIGELTLDNAHCEDDNDEPMEDSGSSFSFLPSFFLSSSPRSSRNQSPKSSSLFSPKSQKVDRPPTLLLVSSVGLAQSLEDAKEVYDHDDGSFLDRVRRYTMLLRVAHVLRANYYQQTHNTNQSPQSSQSTQAYMVHKTYTTFTFRSCFICTPLFEVITVIQTQNHGSWAPHLLCNLYYYFLYFMRYAFQVLIRPKGSKRARKVIIIELHISHKTAEPPSTPVTVMIVNSINPIYRRNLIPIKPINTVQPAA